MIPVQRETCDVMDHSEKDGGMLDFTVILCELK